MICPYCFGTGKITEEFMKESHPNASWVLWMPSGSWDMVERLGVHFKCARCDGTGYVESCGAC